MGEHAYIYRGVRRATVEGKILRAKREA